MLAGYSAGRTGSSAQQQSGRRSHGLTITPRSTRQPHSAQRISTSQVCQPSDLETRKLFGLVPKWSTSCPWLWGCLDGSEQGAVVLEADGDVPGGCFEGIHRATDCVLIERTAVGVVGGGPV